MTGLLFRIGGREFSLQSSLKFNTVLARRLRSPRTPSISMTSPRDDGPWLLEGRAQCVKTALKDPHDSPADHVPREEPNHDVKGDPVPDGRDDRPLERCRSYGAG